MDDLTADLNQMKCVPCRKGAPAITDAEIAELHPQVPDWQIVERDGVNRLERAFKLPNYLQALDFAHKVGLAAEEEDHHPIILIEWRKVTVTWWTHTVRGLHRNDFVMAARTDTIHSSLSQ